MHRNVLEIVFIPERGDRGCLFMLGSKALGKTPNTTNSTSSNFFTQRHTVNHGRTSTPPQNAAATAARHRHLRRSPHPMDHTCALSSLLHALTSSSKMDHTGQLSNTFEGPRRSMGWTDTCTSNGCVFEGVDDGECAGVDRCCITVTFSPCIYPAFHAIPIVLIKMLVIYMCVYVCRKRKRSQCPI